MTPTGEGNQYTCNMLLRNRIEHIYCQPNKIIYIVNAIIRSPRKIDELPKPGRPESNKYWILLVFCYTSIVFFIRIKNDCDPKNIFTR